MFESGALPDVTPRWAALWGGVTPECAFSELRVPWSLPPSGQDAVDFCLDLVFLYFLMFWERWLDPKDSSLSRFPHVWFPEALSGLRVQ